MKLKKGDQVIVIQGKDQGRKGKIEKILPNAGRVLIPGINVYKKHARKKSEKKPGGIIEIVKPLSLSSVALFCSKCRQGVRAGCYRGLCACIWHGLQRSSSGNNGHHGLLEHAGEQTYHLGRGRRLPDD